MELVDREKLIAQYSANPESKGFMELVQDDCIVEALKKAEVVDAVEVVRAKWHDVYLITPWVATGICSHCKLTSHINPYFPHAKYCPNCGAKMDLE